MDRHYSALFSTLFGKFADREFPSVLQSIINHSYVGVMGLDMREFQKPGDYKSLNKLFTRALKSAREIDFDPSVVISPCDCTVVDMGKIESERAYQIKGMSYSIRELLTEYYAEDIAKLEGGEYINFYLSPKDYHRYHIPFDMKIESCAHIPGKLYPVNMPLLKNKSNLYIENERVVLKCRDRAGKIHYMVLVGALNVGRMVLTFEKRVNTNRGSGAERLYFDYEEPIEMKKGELFGWFEMGSTIVVLSEDKALKYTVETGEKISFSQSIGSLKD